MYRLLFIAKNNLKKKKCDVAVLFLLISLSALLLYSSVSILTGIGKVLDAVYEDANTADCLFITNDGSEDIIEKTLLSQDEVTEYDKDTVYNMSAEYRGSLSDEKSNYTFYIGVIEDERSVSILPDIYTRDTAYDSILLPYYFKSNYNNGDTFYITLGDSEYEFTVSGFVEDPMFAIPQNVMTYNVYISHEKMDDILARNPDLKEEAVQMYKVRLQEGTDSEAFENRVSDILIRAIPEFSAISMNWQVMRNADCLMSYIAMGLTLVFSVLLIFVTLIIVRFSIRDFIERNLKNIGIFEACGYTVQQMRATTMLEMGLIALFGSILGVLIGVFGSSVLGNMETMISGLSWNQGINWPVAALSIVLVLLIVIGVAGFSSRIYKKITVLDALRGGIRAHNFRKNHFPLEKSRLPLSAVLSGKEILGEKKKNISILCIVIILSVTTCVGLCIYENFGVNTDKLLDLVGAEIGDAVLNGENLSEAGEDIGSWEEIDYILYENETDIKLSYGNNESTVSCDIWDNPEMLEHEMIIKGRIPRYDNEIVITTNLAKKLGATVGDVVYIELGDNKADYIISGIDQKMNNIGLKTIMTMDGLRRLNENARATALYLYTKEGVTYDSIEEKIQQAYPDIQITDTQKQMSETISTIALGLMAICVAFIIITSLVVMMVEILLIHSKISQGRKNYGINKALGYTTKQLITQIMMTNIPVVLAGSVIGVLISGYLGNRLALACFAIFGIKKIDITVIPLWMVVTVAGVLFVALATSFLAALRIRKIEPVDMLSED